MKKLHRNCSKHSASDKVLRLILLARPRFSSSSSIQIARQASKLFPGNSFAAQEQPNEARNSYVLYSSSCGGRSMYTFMYRCFADRWFQSGTAYSAPVLSQIRLLHVGPSQVICGHAAHWTISSPYKLLNILIQHCK